MLIRGEKCLIFSFITFTLCQSRTCQPTRQHIHRFPLEWHQTKLLFLIGNLKDYQILPPCDMPFWVLLMRCNVSSSHFVFLKWFVFYVVVSHRLNYNNLSSAAVPGSNFNTVEVFFFFFFFRSRLTSAAAGLSCFAFCNYYYFFFYHTLRDVAGLLSGARGLGFERACSSAHREYIAYGPKQSKIYIWSERRVFWVSWFHSIAQPWLILIIHSLILNVIVASGRDKLSTCSINDATALATGRAVTGNRYAGPCFEHKRIFTCIALN